MTTIVLAAADMYVRGAIYALLALEADFRTMGEAETGDEATRLVVSLAPDVLVIESDLDGIDGVEIARQVRGLSSRPAVVIVAVDDEYDSVRKAFRAGAGGYVLKKSCSGWLSTGIREVVAGRRYLSPPLSEEEFREYQSEAEC